MISEEPYGGPLCDEHEWDTSLERVGHVDYVHWRSRYLAVAADGLAPDLRWREKRGRGQPVPPNNRGPVMFLPSQACGWERIW